MTCMFHFSDAIPLYYRLSNATRVIWLDNVGCEGTETRLIDCPANPLGSSNCANSIYAGVLCSLITCTQGDIRLVGETSTEGHVEICVDNIWRTVCDVSWTDVHAGVVCRQLGLPSSCMRIDRSYTFMSIVYSELFQF